MDDSGIAVFKDLFFSMVKNQPEEMKRIRRLYLKEIEADIEAKWTNRERVLMDLKLFKNWYNPKWEEMTEDDLFRHFMDYFLRKG